MSQSLIRPKIYPVLSMVAVLSMVLSACTGSGDSSKSGNFELANDSASTVVPTTKAPTPVPTIPAPTTKKSIEILDKDDGYRATLEFSVSDVEEVAETNPCSGNRSENLIYRVRTVEISLTSIDVNGFQWPSDRKQIFRVDGPNVCPSSAVENQAFGSYAVFIDQPVVLTTFVSATRSPNFPNGDWKAGANEPLTFEILEGAVKGVTAESCKRANGSLKYAHDVHYRNPNEDAYGEVPDDHAITCKLTVR